MTVKERIIETDKAKIIRDLQTDIKASGHRQKSILIVRSEKRGRVVR